MSHVYYSSGERDEDTHEYIVPSKWDGKPVNLSFSEKKDEKSKEKQPAPIQLPKEFDDTYYTDKRDKYSRHTHEYWDWARLRQYMHNVHSAYCVLAKAFSNQYTIREDLAFPDWALAPQKNHIDINQAVQDLDEAEKELVRQFYHFRSRSVQPQFSKHANLRKLQSYGAQVWVMLHILNRDLPVNSVVKFSERMKTLDLSNIDHQLIAYRGCAVIMRKLNLYVKPDMVNSQHGSKDIYAGVDSVEIFDTLMSKIGAMTTREISTTKASIEPSLMQEAKTNKTISALMQFYDKFDDILKTIYDVRKVVKRLISKKNSGKTNYDFVCTFPFIDVDIDIYEEAEDYLNYLNILRDIKYQSDVIHYDIDSLYNDLSQAIETARPWYYLTHKALDGEEFEDNPLNND